MISLLEQKLRQHTNNDALVAALVAYRETAIDDWSKAKARSKALKKAVAVLDELAEATCDSLPLKDYGFIPVTDLQEALRVLLSIENGMQKIAKFRRRIVFEVAWHMRQLDLDPAATKGALLETLGVIMLDACGEKSGGIHRLACSVMEVIRDIDARGLLST